MRTQSEIDEQIKWLEENKRKIQRRNVFGEDNWAKLDAELTVLKEQLTEEDVWDRSAGEGEEDDSKEWDFVTGEAARDAAMWLAGDTDDSPSENWSVLVK